MTKLPFELNGVLFHVIYTYSDDLTLELQIDNNLNYLALFKIHDFIRLNKHSLIEILTFVSEQYSFINKNIYVSFDEWERDLRSIENNKFFHEFDGYIENLLEIIVTRERKIFFNTQNDKIKKPKITNIYLMQNKRNKYVKIGQSKNVKYRERTLQSEEPEIELIFSIRTYDIFEQHLHDKYSSYNVRGEWFNLQDDHIETIKKFLISKEITQEAVNEQLNTNK